MATRKRATAARKRPARGLALGIALAAAFSVLAIWALWWTTRPPVAAPLRLPAPLGPSGHDAPGESIDASERARLEAVLKERGKRLPMAIDALDDTGVTVRLKGPPERIVSLVPSVTELVCALGAAARLIGVTRFCTEPPEIVAALPKIGGTKTPDCAAILSLAPDLVLANSEENRRADYDRLLAAGVPVFVTFPTGVESAARSIERLGRVLDREAPARALARAIDEARAATLARVERRPRVFCPIWRNPWMTFNRDTFAHDILWCAGADNVAAADTERYPRVALADVAARNPEVILLPDEPYRFTRRHLESLRPLADTSAWRDGRIHFVDGKMISWYGARTPHALVELGRLLGCRAEK